MGNQIRLKNIQVTDLTLSAKTFNKEATNTFETALTFRTGFTEGSQYDFATIFKLTLENKTEGFFLKLEATAHFETDAPIDENFKNSSFVKVSAPAIAFPYIRVFVSNLTLNSGYEAIMLPSFNFVKMSEEKEAGNN